MSAGANGRPPSDAPPAFVAPAFLWRLATTFIIAGAGAFGLGLVTAPARAWASLLTAAFYFLTLALGAAVFIALHNVANAGWHAVIRRVPEAFAAYLPVGGITMLGVLAGAPVLYPWVRGAHDDESLHAKAAYLNLPFFAARMVVFLGVWWAFSAGLRWHSARQDQDHRIDHTRRAVPISAAFIIVFAYTFSSACVDWLMSLDPHWSSTIFGIYNISGMLVASVAAITVAVIVLQRRGALPGVGPAHLHDLGKLMFGFSTFWAYIWISQYLLIWYANLPEETPFFLTRREGGWALLFWANLVMGWLLPFVFLLPAPAKRSPTNLLWVSTFVLVGRWLDIYLCAAPDGTPQHAGIGLVEVGTFVGVLGLFLAVVARALESRAIVPLADPYLVESLHHG